MNELRISFIARRNCLDDSEHGLASTDQMAGTIRANFGHRGFLTDAGFGYLLKNATAAPCVLALALALALAVVTFPEMSGHVWTFLDKSRHVATNGG